ncbi:MAG TPA: fibronectin type III domain-containing protein [Anaerolineales bacterium]|nr:fibronectin type III domain-containing protein [Anaerolineales bacterium]
MKNRITALCAAVLILLAACASPASGLTADVTFRPVDDILDTPLEITNFVNGTARLPITTSIPVACTIVYGTTPEFGSLTLDQDMAGGTHSEHNPLLSGLESETTYYYRVQGVDDDGNIYLSETLTFTTPAFADAPTDNLATPANGGEILGYSSAFNDAAPDERWGVGSAFDDDPTTEWSTAGDGSAAWVEVRLAGLAAIHTIAFHTRTMSDGSAVTLAFTVTTDRGEVYGPFEVPDSGAPAEFSVDFEAETLRFDLVETTGGNTGVVDIAVFGDFR